MSGEQGLIHVKSYTRSESSRMIEQSGSGATSRAYDFGRFNEQLVSKGLLSAGSGSRTLLVRSYIRSSVPEMRFLVNTRCITSKPLRSPALLLYSHGRYALWSCVSCGVPRVAPSSAVFQ